jgi:serine/threonine protein kinase/WD40 repeat protein/Flp pilus assembly protein TadD
MTRSTSDRGILSQADPQLAALIDELTDRLQAGEAVDLEAYLRRHPDHAEPLRQLIPALEMMAELKRSAVRAAPSPSAPGRDSWPDVGVLGDFRILREVGRGGMGVVYEAEQISLGRRVALKVLPLAAAMDSKQLQRFQLEAHAAACLHHTNIVPVHAVGCERGVPFYAMQFIEGRSLAQLIADLRRVEGQEPTRAPTADLAHGPIATLAAGAPPKGSSQAGGPAVSVAAGSEMPLPTSRRPVPTDSATPLLRTAGEHSAGSSTRSRSYVRTVAQFGVQIAEALDHAHTRGILHRDIKPGNLLVDDQGQLWVTDFGLAQIQGNPALTLTGDVLGTLRYMSPEQALAKRVVIDGRTDIYSLGVTIYELLTLRPAVEGQDRQEILRRIAQEEPAPLRTINPAVSRDLETVLLKAMAKDPGGRYPAARELADDLRRFLEDKPIRAQRPRLLDRAAKWARRHWPVAATAALGVVVLLAAVSVVASVAALWLRDERNATLNQLKQTLKAQKDGQKQLFAAKLAQAQASRWSGRAGRNFQALSALREAAILARAVDFGPDALLALRNESIACMILPDLRLDQQWEGSPPQSGPPVGIAFEAGLERYARVEADGTVTVRRMADHAILVHINDLGAPARRVVDWRVLLRFSPDGRLLATGSDPHHAVALQVWDLNGPRRLLSVPAPDKSPWFFQHFDFSPDSRTLATGQADGSIALYDVESAHRFKTLAPGSFPRSIRFDPSGRKLALWRDGDSAVQVVDLAGGRFGQPLSHPARVSTTPSWHPDGALLAIGCADGGVYVWNTCIGKTVAVCEGRRVEVTHVAFSQGGDLLASATWDGITRLWDPRTGRQLVSADGMAADFSRGDRWLGWELEGPRVGRWAVATGHECRLLRGAGAQAAVNSLGIHRDGRLLAASANDGVHLWDLGTGKEMRVLRVGRTYSVIFDRAGRSLLTCGTAGLYRWPTRGDPDAPVACLRLGPPQALDLPPGFEPDWCAQSEDGRRVALHKFSSGEVILLEPARFHRRSRSLSDAGLWCPAISPDGRWVATGTWNGYACKIWDAQTGRCLEDFPARHARPTFSPDNRWLVIGTFQEYAFHELNGGRWQCSRRVPRDKGVPWAGLVAFTWDAEMVAVADSSWGVRLLDTHDWREFASLSAPDSAELTALCFSPDGSQLVAGTQDGTIQLWDLRQIRARLREMRVDWEPPAQPSQSRDESKTLRVAMDRGWLPDPERDSLILALCPFDAEAHFRRGLAHARRDQWREALDDFRRALALKPDHAEAHHRRGLLRARHGIYQEAIADWSRTITLEPDHADAYIGRAHSYHSLGQWDQAARDYAKAAELRPDWSECHNDAAWLLATHPDPRRRDAGRALALARRAVELEPEEGDYWNTLGVALYRIGDWRGSIAALENAIAFHGRTSYDEFFLAMSCWQLGQHPEARRAYDWAVEWTQKNKPHDTELRRFRGEAAELLGICGPAQ